MKTWAELGDLCVVLCCVLTQKQVSVGLPPTDSFLMSMRAIYQTQPLHGAQMDHGYIDAYNTGGSLVTIATKSLILDLLDGRDRCPIGDFAE